MSAAPVEPEANLPLKSHRVRSGVLSLLLAPLLLGAAAPSQAAGNGSMAVSAVVVSRSICRFLTGPRTLNFGTLDPTAAGNRTASVNLQFWCLGSAATTTYSLTAGNGSHPAGAGLRRVRHGTAMTEYMGYDLAISPASGTIPWLAVQTVTISGTILPTQFQNATVGAYSDTVVLNLQP